MAVNLIRRNNQEEVTAYQDAVMIHLAKGANGVVPDVGKQFQLTYDNQTLSATVHSGMGVLYGRQFEIKEGDEVVWDWSTISGERYISIYAEVDLRDPTTESAKLKSVYASSDYPSIDTGDNLISTPTGVARMLLYWVKRAANGEVTTEQKFTLLQNDKIVNADKVGGVAITTPKGVITTKLDGHSTTEVVERKRLIFKGNERFYNTVDKGKVISLLESVSEGDILEIIYHPKHYSDSPGLHVCLRCPATTKITNASGLAVVLTSIVSDVLSNNGFSATSDSFVFNGNEMTYKGGYILLNFANGGGTLLENNTICLREIYKIIGVGHEIT